MFPDAPGGSVASLLATLSMAAPAFIALIAYLGARRGITAIAALGIYGYVIETIGVTTGIPYGDFTYTDALGGKLFGLVPYLLPVSYVPLVIGAFAASWQFGTSIPVRIIYSTLLLILMDGVLDPGAAALGFWVWSEGGLYYGIPLSNYFGWLVSGLLASLLISRFGSWETPPKAGMLDGAILGMSFWIGVSFFAGFVVPALLGFGMVIFLAHVRSRLVRGTTV